MREKIFIHWIGVVVKTHCIRSAASEQTSMAAAARP
jgi:hypothetical protein